MTTGVEHLKEIVELQREIKELRKELAIYEKKFIKCCNENVELRERAIKKRVKKIKHEAGML